MGISASLDRLQGEKTKIKGSGRGEELLQNLDGTRNISLVLLGIHSSRA
jgi:hypothetical protein